MRTRLRIEEHEDALCLGLILTDALLFSEFFQSKDLSLEPTVPQKLMFLDYSKRVIACTSRNVAKTVCIIGKILRVFCTYLPKPGTRDDEALVFTPAESHMNPLVDRLFGHITQVPFFLALIKSWNKGDKPKIVTKTGLNIQFRIEGSSNTDTNMVGLHPGQFIIGDECEFGNWICHRSRAGGAMPHTKWFYAGVPNGVRSTVFWSLDKTNEGKTWSHHKFSMLTANPLFLRSKKYRKEIEAAFGGEHSSDYKTQVLGEWGEASVSSFPPGSVPWNKELDYKYYHINLTGADVAQAIRDDRVWMMLKTPSVKCKRACIGWDYGGSPDPTTFLVAIQTEDGAPWQTYCRVSLYQTRMDYQVEVLKAIVNGVINQKLVMLSVDSDAAHQMLLSETNRHLFEGRVKATLQAGTSEVDLESWRVVTDKDKDDPVILDKRARGKISKIRRKYFLTETMKRMFMHKILNKTDEIRLELGYDSEFESELMGCVEEKRDTGYVVYKVSKSRGMFHIAPDQIIDSCRALADAITEVDGNYVPKSVETLAMIAALGFAGKRNNEWKAPWSN